MKKLSKRQRRRIYRHYKSMKKPELSRAESLFCAYWVEAILKKNTGIALHLPDRVIKAVNKKKKTLA